MTVATSGALLLVGARCNVGVCGLLSNPIVFSFRRFFTFNGLFSVSFSVSGLNGNILTFEASVLSSTLNVKNIYKPTAGGGGEDFNNPVNFASSTPLIVGDSISYQAYLAIN